MTLPDINELLPKVELEGMSRRERKKQETRWRIYEAAMTLFSSRDYDSVKIEEICEQADVSNAAFFHHFTSKASLVRAYLEKLKATIRVKLDAAENANSTEKLKIISREVTRANNEVTSFQEQMFSALIPPGDESLDMEQVDRGITGTLSEIIREGQASGEFKKSWKPEVVAVSLVGSWLMMPLAAKSPNFPKKPYDELMKLVLAGLSS